MANLPHVTAQPDLLPWNATGCCAGDKKRQRLKLQGGNTPWSWRAAQLRQEKIKCSQAFHTHTPSSFALYTPPPTPSIPPALQQSSSAANTHHQPSHTCVCAHPHTHMHPTPPSLSFSISFCGTFSGPCPALQSV